MEKIIIAFRSRGHTVQFSNYLRNFGINSLIVSTPKEVGVGCGLSVETNIKNINIVKIAVRKTNLSSFAGIFYVKTIGKNITIKSI